jgi:hypothetical protein
MLSWSKSSSEDSLHWLLDRKYSEKSITPCWQSKSSSCKVKCNKNGDAKCQDWQCTLCLRTMWQFTTVLLHPNLSNLIHAKLLRMGNDREQKTIHGSKINHYHNELMIIKNGNKCYTFIKFKLPGWYLHFSAELENTWDLTVIHPCCIYNTTHGIIYSFQTQILFTKNSQLHVPANI